MAYSQLIVGLAVSVAVVAAITDARDHRIPNHLTYPAMLVGLAVQSVRFGWHGLLASLGGGFVAGGILLLFYMIRAMGAGDVKLAAALGFMVGFQDAIQLLAATAVAGGILALVFMVVQRRVTETLRNTCSVVSFHAVAGLQEHPTMNLGNPMAARMPYGLAFIAGTLYWAGSVLF